MRDHPFKIVPHVLSGDANRLYSLLESPMVAALVPVWIVSEFMGQTIDFNRDCGGFAKEIENERPEWMLSPKMQSIRAQS